MNRISVILMVLSCMLAAQGLNAQAPPPKDPKATPKAGAPAAPQSDIDKCKQTLIGARFALAKGKGYDAKITTTLYPAAGKPYVAVAEGEWDKKGKAHMTINAEVGGIATTTELFDTSSGMTVVLTSAAGGQKAYVQLPASARKDFPFLANGFPELEARLGEAFEESNVEYWVFQTTDIDGYEKYEAFTEQDAKSRSEELQKKYNEAMKKYEDEMKGFRASPEYQAYMKQVETWNKTKQGNKPGEPTQGTVGGKKINKPNPPKSKPKVEKAKKPGPFKSFEEASADAQNRETAMNVKPEPPTVEVLMKRYTVKKDYTISSVTSDLEEFKRFQGVRIVRKDAKAQTAPVDYFFDSLNEPRGIIYHDDAGRKVVVVRIDSFNIREEMKVPEFEAQDGMRKITGAEFEKFFEKK